MARNAEPDRTTTGLKGGLIPPLVAKYNAVNWQLVHMANCFCFTAT